MSLIAAQLGFASSPELCLQVIHFTILGEPASKANSRRNVFIGGKSRSIKSKKALDYEKYALLQVPIDARQRLSGPVCVTLRIFYASQRPDLDESLILDVLQDRYIRIKNTKERVLVQAGVYQNDRQVREKHVYWGLDKGNPRCVVEVRSLEPELPLA